MRGNAVPPSWKLREPIKHERGPNGRPLCTWCHKEVPVGRRSWCCDECVDQYRMATDWGYVRQQVYKRDKGVCRACGIDTEALLREKQAEAREARKTGRAGWWMLNAHRVEHDIDHIIPVEHGGKSTMDNLQTLCLSCHRAKTAKQAADKAALKRGPQTAEMEALR